MPAWEYLKSLFVKRKTSNVSAVEECQASTSTQKNSKTRTSTRRRRHRDISGTEEREIRIPSYVRASVIDKCPVIPTGPCMLLREDTADKLSKVMIKFDSLKLEDLG